MKIKEFKLDNPQWDEFCLDSDDCWFWHTSLWMEYTKEYGGEDSEIISFYLVDGTGNIIAICPLIRHNKIFSYVGAFTPNPALKNGLSMKISKRLLNTIFLEIDKRAKEYNIQEVSMNLTSLAKNHLKKFSYNYLMRYNFDNVSLNTQIIDFKKDIRTLWGEIKKSHRNEIKRGKKIFSFDYVLPHETKSKEYGELKNLHFLSAGRKTRSDESWEIGFKIKLNKNAIIILAKLNDIIVGGIYTFLYKNCAYYGISANHPNYDTRYSISHSIMWEMIKWLKHNRYDYFELGQQYFSNQPYSHPTQKEIDISLFKRHFGGFIVTHHKGLKKYMK